MKLNRSLKFGFTAALSIASAFAVTPTIGVASAFGTFMVNSAEVQGNANIFEGSQIKTGKASKLDVVAFCNSRINSPQACCYPV